MKWEEIKKEKESVGGMTIISSLYRSKVPSGWLFKESVIIVSGIITNKAEINFSIVFIPDENHEWEI